MADASSYPTAPQVIARGLSLIVRLVRRDPVSFCLGLTGAVVFTSGIVAAAWVVGRVTDTAIVPILRDGEAGAGRVAVAAGLLLGVGVWKAAGIILRRSGAGRLQSSVRAMLRRDLTGQHLRLPLAWYRDRSTGDLLSVADNDVVMATGVLAPLPFATGVTLLLVGTLATTTVIDPLLGVLTFGLLLAVAGLDLRGSYRAYGLMRSVQHHRGEVARIAHESFDGAQTVRALGREAAETTRFQARTDALRDELVHLGRTWTGYRALTDGLPQLGIILLLLLGVHRLAAGVMTAGQLVFILYLVSLISVPMRLLGYLLWELAQGIAAMERVDAVLGVRDLVTHGSDDTVVAGAASLGADRVSFAHRPDVPVLRDVGLEIPAGQVVAVVGPTGSGKSTLLSLCARLWDPDTGAIHLDGRDLRDLAVGVVPRDVAHVAQDAFLFDDTVRENVTVGRAVDDAAVRRALAVAEAGFVDELRDGVATHLGERGTTLSGGQRQRIALARALVGSPRLLLLDDATSAVDPSVEARILHRLRDADLPSTVVIVAHRRASILLADVVVHMEDGRVIAQGSHERLLREVPGYARLLAAYEAEEAEVAGVGDGPGAKDGGAP